MGSTESTRYAKFIPWPWRAPSALMPVRATALNAIPDSLSSLSRWTGTVGKSHEDATHFSDVFELCVCYLRIMKGFDQRMSADEDADPSLNVLLNFCLSQSHGISENPEAAAFPNLWRRRDFENRHHEANKGAKSWGERERYRVCGDS